MKKIKIIIERGENQYGAYADNVEGIYGAGDTVAEAKQSVLEAIEMTIEFNSENNIPRALRGEYELVWQFDTVSLLNYYRGIFSNAALERLTGINQKQMQHYAAGLKKPRPQQAKKIEAALHKLGNELLAIQL